MDFRSLIETKLEPVGKSNNDIIYRCPQCDDKSGHLYVNYDREKWHCFKCDAGGKTLSNLLKILNISLDFDYAKLYSEQDSELESILSMKQNIKKEEEAVDYSTDLGVLTEYYSQHTAPLSQYAYNYLMNRGMTPYQISKAGMAEGLNRYGDIITIDNKQYIGRDYSGRIMVPSMRKDGLISFYVGRDYIGDKPAKYLNPPKEIVAASEDVYNLDMVESDSVIICEGVFTALAASPIKMNAVATYGKSIATNSSNDSGIKVTSQGEKLLARRFKNYYVAYDADASDEAIKSCKYLQERGANVYLVRIDPAKYGKKADVADIGYEEFTKLLREAVHYRGELDILG